jgi:hypothetical protein
LPGKQPAENKGQSADRQCVSDVPETIGLYPAVMSTPPLSAQEIRAAAEAHRELGPAYHDAVVESFLAKVEQEIDARVEARLAESQARVRSRQLDSATLARRRLAMKYMVLGSGAVGIPLTWLSYYMASEYWRDPFPSLVVVWILIAAVYLGAAFLLRPSRRDR